MAEANTLSTMNGLFKEVYSNKIEDLIPASVKFTPMVPFVSAEKQLGNQYHQPVILANEHGLTFASSGDAFSLEDAVAGQIKDATVTGYEMVLRGRLSYAAASRAANGRNAFVDSTAQLVKNLRRSIARSLEIELLYGQASWGKVGAVSTTTNTITVETAEWAPGIWAGSVGMKIQAYDALTGGTVQNTAGGATVGGANAMVISSVDITARTLTVDDVTNVQVGDFLYHAGSYAKEMAGVHTILSNTSTLFGINAATYDLWQAGTYSAASAALSFNKVASAVDQAVNKGLDGDVCLMISNRTWTDLLQDQSALRSLDSSFSTDGNKEGAKSITFYSQNGMIEVVPSIFVKEGYGYIINKDEWVRPGSTDVTFNRPGQSDSFFMDLENAAGYELRSYTDQALFCHAPGHQVLLNGIVNS